MPLVQCAWQIAETESQRQIFQHDLFRYEKDIYFTFVYPQLLYGVEVYANTCKSHLEKLTILNNKLLRIAQSCSERTRTVDLYKRYFTLPLPLLHEYNVLRFVHKC